MIHEKGLKNRKTARIYALGCLPAQAETSLAGNLASSHALTPG